MYSILQYSTISSHLLSLVHLCGFFFEKFDIITYIVDIIYANQIKELYSMKKNAFKKIVTLCSTFFTLMLIIGANSNSSLMMHQEKAPEEIKRFSKIR